MSGRFFTRAKNAAVNLVGKVKGEPDVAADTPLADSRAAKDEDTDDGTYVGRSGSDVALDVEQSGAEARSEQKRNATQ